MSSTVAQNKWDALLVYVSRPVLPIFALGFLSGLPLALSASTLLTWLREADVDIETIGLFAAVAVPYTLKFAWAPLMDRLPLPGLTKLLGRRRSWLLVAQGVLVVVLVSMALVDPTSNLGALALLALGLSSASATQDIVIDAFRVERLPEDMQAAGASAIVFGYRIGMLASGGGALFIADALSWPVAYISMAALMGAGIVLTLALSEPDVETDPHSNITGDPVGKWFYDTIVAPFADFLSRPFAIAILLFVIAFKLGDALAGVLTNPFLIDLDFTKSEIATVVKGWGLVGTLVGLAVAGPVMAWLGLIRSLWIAGLLQLLTNFLFLWQAQAGHDVIVLTVVIGFENFAGGVGTAIFVAYLSSLCNTAFTATQYALLTAFAAFGRTWFSATSGFIVEATSWSWFFVITAGAAVPGLLLLYWLGNRLTRQR